LSFGEYLFGIFASSFYSIVFIRGGQSITLPTGATFGVDIQMLILSFWILFMFTLFNPGSNFQFLSLFWLLRGLINKYTKLST
jgi:hypothetical protein